MDIESDRYSLLLLAGKLVCFFTSEARAQDAPRTTLHYNQEFDMQGSGDQSNYDGPEQRDIAPADARFSRGSVTVMALGFVTSPVDKAIGRRRMRNRSVTIGDKFGLTTILSGKFRAGQASIHPFQHEPRLSFLNWTTRPRRCAWRKGRSIVRVRECAKGDVYEIDAPNAVDARAVTIFVHIEAERAGFGDG